MVSAAAQFEEQFKEFREMSGPLVRSVTNFEIHVQTISNSVGLLTSRINNVEQIVNTLSAGMVTFTEMEQNFSALTARMCKVETASTWTK